MSERISSERLREMASPTWRFVGEDYRAAVRELLEWREWGEFLEAGASTKLHLLGPILTSRKPETT